MEPDSLQIEDLTALAPSQPTSLTSQTCFLPLIRQLMWSGHGESGAVIFPLFVEIKQRAELRGGWGFQLYGDFCFTPFCLYLLPGSLSIGVLICSLNFSPDLWLVLAILSSSLPNLNEQFELKFLLDFGAVVWQNIPEEITLLSLGRLSCYSKSKVQLKSRVTPVACLFFVVFLSSQVSRFLWRSSTNQNVTTLMI